jgi:predicted CopG family antitoxin
MVANAYQGGLSIQSKNDSVSENIRKLKNEKRKKDVVHLLHSLLSLLNLATTVSAVACVCNVGVHCVCY